MANSLDLESLMLTQENQALLDKAAAIGAITERTDQVIRLDTPDGQEFLSDVEAYRESELVLAAIAQVRKIRDAV